MTMAGAGLGMPPTTCHPANGDQLPWNSLMLVPGEPSTKLLSCIPEYRAASTYERGTVPLLNVTSGDVVHVVVVFRAPPPAT